MTDSFTILAGQVKALVIENMQQNLMSYWNIGRLVAKAHGNKRKYGSQVVPRLAAECGINARLLFDAHKLFQNVSTAEHLQSTKTSWSAYRKLLSISTNSLRMEALEEAHTIAISQRRAAALAKECNATGPKKNVAQALKVVSKKRPDSSDHTSEELYDCVRDLIRSSSADKNKKKLMKNMSKTLFGMLNEK